MDVPICITPVAFGTVTGELYSYRPSARGGVRIKGDAGYEFGTDHQVIIEVPDDADMDERGVDPILIVGAKRITAQTAIAHARAGKYGFRILKEAGF